MLVIKPLKALKDNYIWIGYNPSNQGFEQYCFIVDPGEAAPVLNVIQSHQFIPVAILITHHHWDHTAGVFELLKSFSHTIPVYGPSKEAQTLVTHPCEERTNITIQYKHNNLFDFTILEIPGHTHGHIAFYNASQNILFTGDTLFSSGCGRTFEGTIEQLYQSIQKINQLPENTNIYCGHEYTYQNLLFAKTIEPDNMWIQEKLDVCSPGQLTLPSTLKIERKINPFLRAKSLEQFTQYRRLKDQF